MRLINANTLKGEFTGSFIDAYPTALVHTLIDLAPTIDAVPVVHSHWEAVFGDTSRWECKNCGRIFDDKDRHEELYCGECGARMDGDKE